MEGELRMLFILNKENLSALFPRTSSQTETQESGQQGG